jgi:hypothetical protein
MTDEELVPDFIVAIVQRSTLTDAARDAGFADARKSSRRCSRRRRRQRCDDVCKRPKGARPMAKIERLSPVHVELLARSGVDIEVAERAGVRSITTPEELLAEAPASWRDQLPGLLFPWRAADGTQVPQLRPDQPVALNGEEPPKYHWPPGQGLVLWQLAEPGAGMVALIEGTKQALAAASHAPEDVAVYGMAGCLGWAKVDLSFAAGREVVVVFDADLTHNRMVWDAASKLQTALETVGAAGVRFATVPAFGSDGLDDFLGRTPPAQRTAAFENVLMLAKPKLPGRQPASGQARMDTSPPPPQAPPEPVLPKVKRNEGAAILDEVERTYLRFVAFPSEHEPVAQTLWTAHTWAIGTATLTPYGQVTSPAPECGKSTLGQVAKCLVARPWPVVVPSAAALYHKLSADPPPTAIIDEFDLYAKGDETAGVLRAVLNAGYARGATIPRMMGASHDELREYSLFGLKLLIGIGRLPTAALASRTFPIRLRRATAADRIEEFDEIDTPATLEPLRDRLHAWVALVEPDLGHPEAVAGLGRRQAGMWRQLIAIADAAGGDWPHRARAAARHLYQRSPTDDFGSEVTLLECVYDAFADADDEGVTWLASEKLLKKLVECEVGPGAERWSRPLIAGNVRGPAAPARGVPEALRHRAQAEEARRQQGHPRLREVRLRRDLREVPEAVAGRPGSLPFRPVRRPS